MLHFYWMRAGKQRFTEVAIYGALIAALLLWRIWWSRQEAQRRA
jgi:sulfoxide reductase heme-binding subunit YedZ